MVYNINKKWPPGALKAGCTVNVGSFLFFFIFNWIPRKQYVFEGFLYISGTKMLSNSTKIVPEGIFNRCISTLLNTKRLPRKTSEATKRTSIPLRFMSVTAFAKCPHKSIKISKEKLFIATSWLFHRGSRRFKISKKIPGRVQALSGLLFCLYKLLVAFAYITR